MAIGKLAGTAGEARERARQDAAGRKSAAPRILSPNDMQGEYDASRLLTTTLGTGSNEPRQLTADDIAAFRQNARALGNKFVGGITARQVIDQSTRQDRERARREITVAVPSAARALRAGGGISGLEVRFVTNASMRHGESRYFVNVNFLGYPSAASSGALSPAKAASLLRKQGITFECSCPRHRYWYRYMATVGKYNYGRPENGYPRVRNPGLVGVACKHALRVMAEIEGSGMVLGFLTRVITKGRAADTGRASIRTSQKEADELASKQAKRSTTSTKTGDRDYDRARLALRKQSRSVTAKPKRVASGSKRVSAMAGDPAAEKALLGIISQLGISRDQAIAIIKGATK